MSLGVYVHIPFCKSKCRYCDFNSSDGYWNSEDYYTDAVISEINHCDCAGSADTVFFGGGTPTAIKTDNLLKIIDAVNSKFSPENAEFTVECNPATADYADFVRLKTAGVNRLSIGLQSANDDELRFLGRIHTFDMFLKTYNDAVKAGFSNINIDLMFSLHNQTVEKWNNTLRTVTDLKPQHISCYSLIIEEGTPFYNMNLNLPDEETDRKMYYDAIEYLSAKGYKQYEISNFAHEDFECRHNIKYWKRDNYLGFGCGASGLYNNVRIKNTENIYDYIKNNRPQRTFITRNEAKSEHIFLGLRMIDGFNIDEFNSLYNADFLSEYKDVINKYKKFGLLETGENCKLTKEGLSVSNSVMCEFV